MKTRATESYRALIANPERYSSQDVIRAHTFVENVVDARDNGYPLVCAECGMGIATDGADEDQHEVWCEMAAKELAALAEFSERLERIQRGEES